jgi:hypothetical protein
MAQRTYEGEPIDGTMKHISERDLEEEAEDVDVPQDDQYEGEVSAEYGFLTDDNISKKEKVQRLWERSDYDYDEWGSITEFYEEKIAPVLDVNRSYVNSAIKDLVQSESGDGTDENNTDGDDSGEVQEESVDESDVEDATDTTRTESKERVFSEAEIEHDVLKPLVFAQKFASGEELEALQEAEELVEVLLNKGDQ